MICQREFTVTIADAMFSDVVWIEPTDGTNDRLPITAEHGYVNSSWSFSVSGSATDRLIWMVHVTNGTADNYNIHMEMGVSGVINAINGSSPHVSTLVRYGLAGPPVSVPTAGTVIANDATLGSVLGPYSRSESGDYVLNAGLDIWFAVQWDPFRVSGTIDGTLICTSSIV